MRSFALDLYGGMVPAQHAAVGRQTFILPSRIKRLRGWEGAISVFGPQWFNTGGNAPYYFPTPGMHGDAWLSLMPKALGDKAGDDVFGLLKSGDSGHDSKAVIFPEPYLLPTSAIYVNYWVHNMRGKEGRDADDWHVGYALYY